MLKMVEDALVAAQMIPGDDPKYVAQVTVTAEKVGKTEDEVVEITLSCAAEAY